MAIVYVHPRCGTCKKALAWLKEEGFQVEPVDLLEAPPNAEVLASAFERSEQPLKAFFNTSGQSYRNGGWKDRMATLTREQALEALAADPMLLKRPLLDAGPRAFAGFDKTAWAGVLSSSGALEDPETPKP